MLGGKLRPAAPLYVLGQCSNGFLGNFDAFAAIKEDDADSRQNVHFRALSEDDAVRRRSPCRPAFRLSHLSQMSQLWGYRLEIPENFLVRAYTHPSGGNCGGKTGFNCGFYKSAFSIYPTAVLNGKTPASRGCYLRGVCDGGF